MTDLDQVISGVATYEGIREKLDRLLGALRELAAMAPRPDSPEVKEVIEAYEDMIG